MLTPQYAKLFSSMPLRRLLSYFGLALYIWPCLLLASCQASSTAPMPAKPSLTYLALGDSYTIGHDVEEADRWSVQLVAMLNAAAQPSSSPIAQPQIIATTGWTTAELSEGIDAAADTNHYSMVSLLIGVNNQYRGQPTTTYRSEFAALLARARGYARGRADKVFVLSIPDWGVTPAGASRDRAQVAAEIDAYNAVAKEECARVGIAFIDITPTSRLAASEPKYIASDDLHFSGLMYKKWAEIAFPTVQALLAKP